MQIDHVASPTTHGHAGNGRNPRSPTSLSGTLAERVGPTCVRRPMVGRANRAFQCPAILPRYLGWALGPSALWGSANFRGGGSIILGKAFLLENTPNANSPRSWINTLSSWLEIPHLPLGIIVIPIPRLSRPSRSGPRPAQPQSEYGDTSRPPQHLRGATFPA
ncbi:hypothetical protein PCH_Pc20g13390 [Penicillium rubens Wisconsin 54-1255]|uniref:Uncharacterized protein n=1 Tax=Penicillium rubens (strain ATCC 28089 / DSM 1075 / NRRL 1951 / Wisconsin 54-1255) TaxID=500485 RepID=B6HGX8_PENRW|nr:hypothetical protein PCH_Pc20g13390 [Penicillium rubens Wisconsin 54-1255]